MKKIILSGLLSLIFTATAFSQVSWNAKAGMNFSKETKSDVNFKPGYQVGLGMDYFFTEQWGIQTGLTFITKGYKFEGDYYMPGKEPEHAKSRRITKNNLFLELPLLMAFRVQLNDDFRLVLSAGGYGAYGIGGKYKTTITKNNGSKAKESDKIYPNDKRWDAGLASGIALEFRNKYSIGFMGEWGLVNQVSVKPKHKHQSYMINLGYKF